MLFKEGRKNTSAGKNNGIKQDVTMHPQSIPSQFFSTLGVMLLLSPIMEKAGYALKSPVCRGANTQRQSTTHTHTNTLRQFTVAN